MSGSPTKAVIALTRRYLLDHPWDAARQIESMDARHAAASLAEQPVHVLLPLWQRLVPPTAAALLLQLPEEVAIALLSELQPGEALRVLAPLDDDQRERFLDGLAPPIQKGLRSMMVYPKDSAGRLMDTRIAVFRGTMTVGATLNKLRQSRVKTARSLFLIDDDNKLTAKVSIQDLALANPEQTLEDLAQPVTAVVGPVSTSKEVADTLERDRFVDLPVVDVNGVLLGVIYHAALVQTVHEDATADIQKMVGASKDERALSKAIFAVRKRLPWLEINLLTAFMAAAVVGLFEDTIAKFTALAVLLPVVAGQSGNAGAQALAVTMRGLALREITVHQWLRVTLKEVNAGFINGLAVAVTCGIGVYFWSGSLGLVLVISMAMVLAMVSAGFAGALVPIVLTKLGQDPAQSSSIILTTVTDIAGFFSFLGLATIFSGML